MQSLLKVMSITLTDSYVTTLVTFKRIKNRLKSSKIKIKKFFSTKILDISWLIKADDDIAINSELLAENLLTLNPSEDQIYCHVRWFPAPNRKGGSKW